jgi:HAMP domain-containing protein
MNIKPSGLMHYFRPSIAKRMAVTLTLFGIVIGYLVFIMLFTWGTGDIINLVTKRFEESIFSLFPDDKGDRLLGLIELKDQNALKAVRLFAEFSSGMNSIKNIRLFYKSHGVWYGLYRDGDNKFHTEIINDPIIIRKLQESLSGKKISSPRFNFGASDTIDITNNLTRSADKNSYVLTYSINRPDIITFMKKNPGQNILFCILLLLFSYLIGLIFGRGIVRPVEDLSREADIIASGDFEREFHTDSRDEIGQLADSLNSMAASIRAAMKERADLLLGILTALTRSIDAKSRWTAGHSERVTRYTMMIGWKLGLSDEVMDKLMVSAVLHDIGKIAVPEAILDKPGRLTSEEFAIIKSHPSAGAGIIGDIPSYDAILPGILYHHERWDGKGYPEGLKAESIPFFARIIAIADVYDAVTEDRPYRKAMSQDEVLGFISDNKGKMFDPHIADIFLSIINNPDTWKAH